WGDPSTTLTKSWLDPGRIWAMASSEMTYPCVRCATRPVPEQAESVMPRAAAEERGDRRTRAERRVMELTFLSSLDYSLATMRQGFGMFSRQDTTLASGQSISICDRPAFLASRRK